MTAQAQLQAQLGQVAAPPDGLASAPAVAKESVSRGITKLAEGKEGVDARLVERVLVAVEARLAARGGGTEDGRRKPKSEGCQKAKATHTQVVSSTTK